jgi:acetyl-CoA acetyltransferase
LSARSDIGLIELNEAFAAQSLAVIRAWAGSGAGECEWRGDCAGASAGVHGAKLTASILAEMAAAEGAVWDGDDVRGGRMGAAGIFERMG